MTLSLIGIGIVLVLIQVLAALPWLAVALGGTGFMSTLREAIQVTHHLLFLPIIRRYVAMILVAVPVVVVSGVVFGIFGLFFLERGYLEQSGQAYAALLQLQLTVDFFIGIFALLLLLWPKGGAVAQAAFREGVRQPLFWLLAGAAFCWLSISPFVPYFTFGEDHLVVKELGYDTIMLAAALFGTLAASISISEEIEGRTAVTLMSKPVSRRQFLLGKFAGILLAALLMVGLLGIYFESILRYKHWWDRLDATPTPAWVSALLDSWQLPAQATDQLRGVGLWIDHTIETLPGLILSFCQVMVLISVAVTLATVMPMVVNLSCILGIYFLAHLTPVLVAIGRKAQKDDPGSVVAQLVGFMSQLFDTLLPALSFFQISPAIISDNPIEPIQFFFYVGSVAFYGVLYTGIVLLFGLILFEDRDLA